MRPAQWLRRATGRTGGPTFAVVRGAINAPPASYEERISAELAEHLHGRLNTAPVKRLDPPDLGEEAWRIADELGWGRTYDAEYVALAKLLNCRLVTLDMPLRRGADRLGFVLTPTEL